MRAMLTAALSLVLLGAPSVSVGAEELPDPMAPAFFTFDEPVALSPEEEAEDEYSDEFAAEVRGDIEVGYMEATDPRASGLLTSVNDVNQLLVGRGGLAAAMARLRLVNDRGAWSGTRQGFLMITERGGGTTMAVLTGEGAYQGLTLVMVEYADDDAQTRRGVIFPSDQSPPVPDPEAAPAERPRRAASAAHAGRGVNAAALDPRRTMERSGRHRSVAPELAAWTAPSHRRTRPACV